MLIWRAFGFSVSEFKGKGLQGTFRITPYRKLAIACQAIVMAGFSFGCGVWFQSYTEPGYVERSN